MEENLLLSRRRRSRRQNSPIRRGEPERGAQPERSEKRKKMVRVATYFAMTFGAFLFWQSMDRVHVWIALHQDEKKERMERELEIKRMQAELMAQAKESDS
ncbi:hypothetical protein PAHAL_5G050300 [Panicum hallii]|uniref:Uncharacterized protein n=1 Tax=Panicum hallii TaxID=206008 RepID=A0A2S3HNW4_9POAL|nr:hypothetical protein PAHAL_5G050300 [Panicum hallii]